jgi:hypothetical protein
MLCYQFKKAKAGVVVSLLAYQLADFLQINGLAHFFLLPVHLLLLGILLLLHAPHQFPH